LLYRPGDRGLAIRLFELLGCQCDEIDAGDLGRYLVVRIEPAEQTISGNVFYLSEIEPEQLELEKELERQMNAGGSELATTYARFHRMREERPYRAGHIGLRLPSLTALEAVLDRMQSGGLDELSGRATVCGVMRPTPERANSGWPVQAFVWTDIVSAGYLSAGQMIELQGAQDPAVASDSTLESLPDGVSLTSA
jgi:hypothetical protein